MQEKELKDKLSAFDGIFKKVKLRADYKDAFDNGRYVGGIFKIRGFTTVQKRL
jgi:hypothetical protein